MTVKVFALLFLATFAGTTSTRFDFSEIDQAAAEPVFVNNRKIEVGQSKALKVSHEAAVGVPIQFMAGDYNGPYDPADPTGVKAAQRRRAHMEREQNVAVMKSYIPPGLGEFTKKEVVKLAVSEGKRFALSHPVESAELLGIVTKAKALYTTTSKKLEELEKKEAHLH